MDEAMEEAVEEEMNICFEALKKHQAIDVNYIDFLEVDKDVQVAEVQSIEEIVKERKTKRNNTLECPFWFSLTSADLRAAVVISYFILTTLKMVISTPTMGLWLAHMHAGVWLGTGGVKSSIIGVSESISDQLGRARSSTTGQAMIIMQFNFALTNKESLVGGVKGVAACTTVKIYDENRTDLEDEELAILTSMKLRICRTCVGPGDCCWVLRCLEYRSSIYDSLLPVVNLYKDSGPGDCCWVLRCLEYRSSIYDSLLPLCQNFRQPKAWEKLEKAEHERELALREELIRQEKLEQLAARFDRKAGMRETWLSENQRLVSQDNFGFDLASVEAAAKKHEAIETDIYAYEERVQAVVAVAKELEAENYHDIDRINARKDNVLRLWNYLLELLRARRSRLEHSLALQQTFQEMIYILDTMEEIKVRLMSDDYGKHLMGVEDLLQKQSLIEADINVLGERVKAVIQHSQRFIVADQDEAYKPCDPQFVVERIQQLEAAYSELVQLALERRNRLEESRTLWQFYWDMTDEEAWIKEKEQILSSEDIGHDLTTVHLLISKNKAMENEIQAHEPQLQSVLQIGHDLIDAQHFGAAKIQERINQVNEMWQHLNELQAHRTKRLIDAIDYHQFFVDADDVDTWMLDTLRLVSSEDVGRDEANVQSLLKKHKDVTDELKNYANSIDSLHQQASTLGEQDREAPEVLERLSSIDRRYKELLDLAKLRKQRLLDALSLYKLFNEADGVEQWIEEKEKMLDSMVLTRDMEDIEVMKHRFEGFEQEMNGNASRVAVVNQLARQLLHVEHPNSQEILNRQNELNQKWAKLRDQAEKKKEEINSSHGVQTFHIECKETISWIEEKTKILQATEELGNDLTGIMTLQRRLSGMERDLAAIQNKLDFLEKEAEKIQDEQPEEARNIQERVVQIKTVWEQLTQLLKDRDAKLEEAGDLHRFLRDLDQFQMWLTKTQTDVASEDIPTNLAEAEKLLQQHQTIKEEIDNITEDYNKMMEYGENVTQDQTDPQYMFLRERIKALQDGWAELHKMWENRQELLSQSLNLQMFLRDSKQAEVFLNQQEHYLSKDETPANLEQAENLIKRHEAFLTTMEANDEKINGVVQFAQRLCDESHFDSEKINRKAEDIIERRNANHARAAQQMDRLKDELQLHQFLQDCEQLSEWIQEKFIIAQDETYRSAKTIHSKWMRHQAFDAEVASNKDRMFKVEEAGRALIAEKPEMKALVEPRLTELAQQFEALERTTRDKGEKLFDANRQVLYEQTCDDIDSWITELENQVLTSETGQDLTSVNHILQKQQVIETQMAIKAKQVTELQGQAQYLEKMDPEKTDEIKVKKEHVETRFDRLQAPLLERKQQLLKKKEAYQFRRDVEDEKLWIREKLPPASSTEYGISLFNVQMLQKKNQSLRTEIDNHEPRITNICENGRKLINEGHEDSDEFNRLIEELMNLWDDLIKAMDHRRYKLLESERVHQYYYDASEAEAWMSEQELYMMVEDRGKDEISAQNLMKKHETLENAVEDYAETVRQLGETAKQLIQEGHPDSDQIAVRQSQVDKLYAGLKNLALERRGKLDEALQLFSLNREVDDLMQWISDKEVIAGSHELGQDYEQVTMFQLRFKQFARDTEETGKERVAIVNESANQLIAASHSDSAAIAEWKDNLNDAWADLLELIETRTQMLAASWQLHKFFHDCKDVYSRIQEKLHSMSDELGRDAVSVSSMQRKHTNFEHDLHTLGAAVQQIQEESAQLQNAYAGDKAQDIISREGDVVRAWENLLAQCDARKSKLADTGDLYRFLNMVRDLILWMDDLTRQMNASEKPRDVSGVEILMNNHRSLKAEIDTREDSFSACINLGRELLDRNHYASNEITEKLLTLKNQREAMIKRWEERWEHLRLILEVYQFSKDAAVAEAWLIAQEPYLLSQELGHTIDEVEQLIKKHEAFEKSASTQDERFQALSKRTAYEYKEMKRKEEELARQREAEQEALKAQQEPVCEEPADRPDSARQISPEPVSERESAPETSAERVSPTADEEIHLEGTLIRKVDWESNTKRSSNRSWDKIYVVLHGRQMTFYKDQKHYKQEPDAHYRNESPIDLRGGVAQADIEYTKKKKKQVFRIKTATGAEYLFLTKDEEEMNSWLQKLQAAMRGEEAGEPSRSKTLPARAEGGDRREEPKKRTFFTLKKK
ncbi:SPTBN1 [Cordylochernes scorpioides]|uniref:Spectrin beta chain n=1 Tax=Cordylochernes scorpioides TaxID=51811 RepID=A0ABY6KQY2_9ARAC|nr:SPTBN1 [Cordylochernes scorpioides]